MNQRLTRRQFGQLAIVGTAGAGFATLATIASKTFAQTPALTPELAIIGVRPGQIISDSTRTLELQYLNLVTSQVETVTTAATLQSADQITGFTALADNSLIVAITSASTSEQGGDPTRLLSLGTSPKTVNVSGLNKQEVLESLLVLNDGSLVGLVVRKDGQPPIRLVDIDPPTGKIIDKNRIKLAKEQRYSNLAQCPDGKIYTTSVARDGTTSLVQLELAQKKSIAITQLRLDNMTWNNGLQSLACSPASQLLALGALFHATRQSLHIVDVKTGNMSRLPQAFQVTKITLARTEG